MKTSSSKLTILLQVAAFFLAAAFVETKTFAQQPVDDAPLVENLKELKDLNRRLVKMAVPGSEATVALISKRGGGAGSGVVVSEDGLILTAAHVVDAMSEGIVVIFPDGTHREARALGADFDRDAGMVRITEEGSYPHVELGSNEALLRNQWCVAVGHPGGYDPARTPPLRLGRILHSGRFLITDCAIVGGDSGGPLFDTEGRVIGIHSNIGLTLSENRHVPIDVYLDQWDRLAAGQRFGKQFSMRRSRINPDRAVLGVEMGESAEPPGVLVTGVLDGSPAGRKGLKEGDVITAINEDEVMSPRELTEAVNGYKPGEGVSITYLREEQEKSVRVTLARLGDLLFNEERPGESGEESAEDEKEPPLPKDGSGGDSARERNDAGERSSESRLKSPKENRSKGESSEMAKNLADELVKRAIEDGLLELTPEEIEEAGGLAELANRLKKRLESLGEERLRELSERPPPGPDLFFESSMKALAPVIRKAAGTTVSVSADEILVALGTVVTSDGWILTKDSETREGEILASSGDEEFALELIQRFPDQDLALFGAESQSLKPVTWAAAKKETPIGTLLTASGSAGDPLGIGLVSVETRPLGEMGFLGIQMEESEEGIRVVRTLEDGPAAKAGLKQGDVILAIDGEAYGTPFEFGQAVRGRKAGEEVALDVLREGVSKEIRVTLGEREEAGDSPRFDRMNRMSGPLSEKKGGFPSILQHDIPLQPFECGGPLLTLDGRCVGINVARAGRVETFAIPAADVQSLVAGARARLAEEGKTKPDSGSISSDERDEIFEALKELREMANDIEKRVRELEIR